MATRQDRINWLIARPKLWQGWPNEGWSISPEFIERHFDIIDKMREAGLFSPKTLDRDIHLQALIQAARKQIRGRK